MISPHDFEFDGHPPFLTSLLKVLVWTACIAYCFLVWLLVIIGAIEFAQWIYQQGLSISTVGVAFWGVRGA